MEVLQEVYLAEQYITTAKKRRMVVILKFRIAYLFIIQLILVVPYLTMEVQEEVVAQ